MGSFLGYLTVFKARLASCNIVLSVTGLQFQAPATVERRVRQILDETVSVRVDDVKSHPIFDHLIEKRIVSKQPKSKGRYRGLGLERGADGAWQGYNRSGDPLQEIPIHLVDIWMSDERLPSTVGAPTPDNTGEAIELAQQLGLLSRAKQTWTSAGQLTNRLRELSASEEDAPNPFILRVERVALLRQLVQVDGLLLREFVAELTTLGPRFSRDDVAERFSSVVERAVAVAKHHKAAQPELREMMKFRDLICRTEVKRATHSRAPGVLEHRVAPRLEWLVDLGYLSKDGFARNGFEYRTDTSLGALAATLEAHALDEAAEDAVALSYWRSHEQWRPARMSLATCSGDGRFLNAYRILRRSIGPLPLRDVGFVADLISLDAPVDTQEELKDFAKSTPGVSLSGGRTGRSPVNIYIEARVLD